MRAFLLAAVFLAIPAAARAEPAPPPRVDRVEPEARLPSSYPDFFVEEGPRPATLALEANVLGLAIGLFSMNLEYVIDTHHVAVISPHYYYAVPGRDDEITGGGIELGYRYYTRKNGPEGWFLGGSFLFGKYRYIYRRSGVPLGSCLAFEPIPDCPDDTSYDSYGVAIDAGYQFLIREHLVVGGGAGLMYRYFTDQPRYEAASHANHDLIYGSGLRPRFLLTIGGAL